MIKMRDVHKTYVNGVTALNGITIDIDQGEFVYIVGSSGAGKSTFIRLMYREAKPSEGSITINDMDLGSIKRSTSLFYAGISVLFFRTLSFCRN